MINNRQGGRRRGRGGQRGQNLGGQPGNRQDNRQRGNAAQLLEKYKSLARDAQLSGDRVQTEYYLQYADHYFRVLSENRARFDEQNQHNRRQRDEDLEDEGDEEMERAEAEAEAEERDDRQDRNERLNRRDRRPRRGDGSDLAARDSEDRDDTSRMNGRGETIPFDALPPAIGRDGDEEPAESSAKESPRPRRRSRGPRAAEGDEEAAPAA